MESQRLGHGPVRLFLGLTLARDTGNGRYRGDISAILGVGERQQLPPGALL